MCLQRFGTCVREHKASLIPRPPCQCLLVCRDKSYEGLTKRFECKGRCANYMLCHNAARVHKNGKSV